MKLYAFPKIGQLKDLNRTLSHKYEVTGTEPEQLEFTGSIKLHGTNAGIVYDVETGTIYAQSKAKVIVPGKADNAGFAQYVEDRRVYFTGALEGCIDDWNLEAVVIYGEWAGKKVIKGAAICNIEKTFFPFLTLYVYKDGTKLWRKPLLKTDAEQRVYNILDYPNYTCMIDFKCPEDFEDRLGAITDGIEKECPVAKSFGVSGIGEGVVWVNYYGVGEELIAFKVKGDAHKVTQSKSGKKAQASPEEVANIQEFATYAVTPARVDQAVAELFEEGYEYSKRDTGKVINWVFNDIIKEENGTLLDNGLTAKQVEAAVKAQARTYYFKLV